MTDIAFPKDFIESLNSIEDLDSDRVLKALNEEPYVSVRINPRKNSTIKSDDSVSWCENGYYLKERPQFTLDPNFHTGAYYVQEASSMYVEHLLKVVDKSKIKTVLDLCAAPGGKTSHLMSMFPDSVVFANEINRKRYQILKENLIKHGGSNALLSNKTSEHIKESGSQFDLVLVDAPCSGEGMFRKDLNARSEWSLNNVNICVERQEEIIDNISSCVKTGGYLIYSTCTFNLLENDQMIKRIIDHGFELIHVDKKDENIIQREINEGSVNSFIPGYTKGEGFFAAILRKVDEGRINRYKNKFKFSSEYPFNEFLNREYKAFKVKNSTFLMRVDLIDHIKEMNFDFVFESVLSPGEIKGKNYIPDHSITMSVDFNNVDTIELSKEEALDFLRKKDVKLKSDRKGMQAVSFNGNVLGWVKIISSTRTNNYYPKEYRIRNL